MKVFIRFVLLAAFLMTACSAPAMLFAREPSVRSPGARSPTPTLSPTLAPSLTPRRDPTPTALPLPTRVTRERSAPESAPSAERRESLLEQYLPDAEQVAESEHFVFFAQDGYFPVEMEWWLEEAETVYAYVSQRVQAEGQSKVHLAFMRPETRACPVRGLAAQETPPTVLLYADEQSPRAYLLAVLAHELGHAIPYEGFPGGLPDDLALTEGLATWASGKYWAAWKQVPEMHDLVRGYIRDGVYEPIHENVDMEGIYPWQGRESGGDGAMGNGGAIGNGQDSCLARRDQLYTQWGSFLGYLVETYGWEQAHRLFAVPPEQRENGRVIEFPPDYEGVYGKALNQLEAEWLAYLRRPTRETAWTLPGEDKVHPLFPWGETHGNNGKSTYPQS